jgi:hypothetical protein
MNLDLELSGGRWSNLGSATASPIRISAFAMHSGNLALHRMILLTRCLRSYNYPNLTRTDYLQISEVFNGIA